MSIWTSLAMVFLPSSASLAPLPSDNAEVCHLKQQMIIVHRLDEMPDVMAEFDHQKLVMVEPGEKIGKDDKTVNLERSHRQFLRAYRSKTHVIVWYVEKGGFVDLMHIIGLRMIADNSGIARFRLASGEHLSGNPCYATQALLDGVRAAANTY